MRDGPNPPNPHNSQIPPSQSSGSKPSETDPGNVSERTRTEPGNPAFPSVPPPNAPILPALQGYEILSEIGKGGMGVIYKGRHRMLQDLVAIKMIRGQRLDPNEEQMLLRFLREMKLLAQVKHPNVVQVRDAGCENGTYYFVMELLDGMSLQEAVKKKGPLSPAQAKEVLRQVCRGLQALHERQLVHRDIKPDNLFWSREGKIKLLDLGLARSTGTLQPGNDHLTGAGNFMGTPDFVAPEQVSDASTASFPADIYSLGCTIYYLLTARVPYPMASWMDRLQAHCNPNVLPTPLGSLKSDCPSELIRIVSRMMAKNIAYRYPSVQEILKDLKGMDNPEHQSTIPSYVPTPVSVPASQPIGSSAIPYPTDSQPGQSAVPDVIPTPTPALSSHPTPMMSMPTQEQPKQRSRLKLYLGGAGFLLLVVATVIGAMAFSGGSGSKDAPKEDPKKQAQNQGTGQGTPEIQVPPPPSPFDDGPAKSLGIMSGHTTEPICVAFTPDGKRAISGQPSSNRAYAGFRLWDLTRLTETSSWQHTEKPAGLAVSKTGKFFYSCPARGYQPSKALHWDLPPADATNPPSPVAKKQLGEGGVICIALSPDETMLACGTTEGFVEVWERSSGKLIQKFRPGQAVYSVAFSPDNRLVISGSESTNAQIWHIGEERQVHLFQKHPGAICGVAFSRDGKHAYSLSFEGSQYEALACVWNVESGQIVKELKLPNARDSSWFISCAISGYSGQALVGKSSGTIILMDLEAGKPNVWEVSHGDKARVNCLAFSPNGRLALSGANDNLIRFWRLPK